MDSSIFTACINLFVEFLGYRGTYFGFDLSNLEIMIGLCCLGLVFYFIGRILE